MFAPETSSMLIVCTLGCMWKQEILDCKLVKRLFVHSTQIVVNTETLAGTLSRYTVEAFLETDVIKAEGCLFN